MIRELKVDGEFKKIIPPLSEEEYNNLEKSIKTEGCRDAIVIWDGVIIDGHNRYEICKKWGIQFETIEKHFALREEAISWICLNQMSRRNLTKEAYKYLIGKRYDAEKAILRNAQGRNQYKSSESKIDKENSGSETQKTSKRLAREYHLTHSTIEQYGKYSRSLDKIERKRPGILPSLLSGRCRISQRNIATLANMSAPKVRKAIEEIKETRDAIGMAPLKATKDVISKEKSENEEKPKEQLVIRIKEMPQYNPDSEIQGLMYTISTWIDMINRLKGIPVRHASEQAKKKMYETLGVLQQAISDLKKEMEGRI